jgi:pyridoxamine 5'-phosphate oxidase
MDSIADIRQDYKMNSLLEVDIDANPFVQFTKWWDEALVSKIEEVNAMTLATVGEGGRPSARIVLLKGMSENGFEFFTNYESHKAKEMATNKNVALIFFWKELERQIRIEGTVEKLSAEKSDIYFNSRPVESRIGAWSSPQSSVIENREILEDNVITIKHTFENTEITRPPFWGGYIVQPTLIEFWQGRSSRLHDRIEYFLEEGIWKTRRLAP